MSVLTTVSPGRATYRHEDLGYYNVLPKASVVSERHLAVFPELLLDDFRSALGSDIDLTSEAVSKALRLVLGPCPGMCGAQVLAFTENENMLRGQGATVGTRLESVNGTSLNALPWPEAVHVLRRALPPRSLRGARRKNPNIAHSSDGSSNSSCSNLNPSKTVSESSSLAPTPALASAQSKLDRGVITQAEYEAIAKSHSALEMAQDVGSNNALASSEDSTSGNTCSDSSGNNSHGNNNSSGTTNTSNSDGRSANLVGITSNGSNTTATDVAAQTSWSLVLCFKVPGTVVLRVHDLEGWRRGVRLGPGLGGFGVTVEAVADDCSAWDLKNDHSRSGDNESLFLGLRAGHRLLCVNNHELACSDGGGAVLYQPIARSHLAKAGLLRNSNDSNNSASTVPRPLNRAVNRLAMSASNLKVHGSSNSSGAYPGSSSGGLAPGEDQPIRRMASKGTSFSSAFAGFSRTTDNGVSVVVSFI